MRQHTDRERLQSLQALFRRDENWLIVINADPDAMASAMALRRIMLHRAGNVVISHVNTVTRPDNLAMIRYLQIPLATFGDTPVSDFRRFALVDSQPHHNPLFAGLPFSIVIDHHPLLPEHPCPATYCDIRPSNHAGSGTTSAIMTDYLQALGIRPGVHLATALQYGIRTDTAVFTRNVTELDLQAYLALNPHADAGLLRSIMSSEYLPEWLKYFSRAFSSLHSCGPHGRFAYVGEIEHPDILVVVADFFTRVHGLYWIVVGGVCGANVVLIFRGDDRHGDVGALARARFGALGSAGGHRCMARAEFSAEAAHDSNLEAFICRQLTDVSYNRNTGVHADHPASC